MKIVCKTDCRTRMYVNRMRDIYESEDVEDLAQYLTQDRLSSPERVAKVLSKYAHSCYAFAAYLALILDYYNIPYNCYIGVAQGRDRPKLSPEELDNIVWPNHVWIESRGKYYELFEGENNIDHLKILYKVEF